MSKSEVVDRQTLNMKSSEKNINIKGTASIKITAVGIMKNIIGSGIVCMPQVMLYASIIPCLLMTGSIYVISAYSFFLIGKLCLLTDCQTYKDLWDQAFNGKNKWMVDFCILFNCVGGSVAYVILFGDFGTLLMKSFGIETNERVVMLCCHIILQLLILPENLDALKPLALIGMLAAVYFMIYATWVGSKYLLEGHPLPDKTVPISQHIWVTRFAWLAPFATLTSTFSAHYNAPRFLNEMKIRKLSNFRIAVWSGFNLSLVPNFLVMLFGFFAMNSYGFHKDGEKMSGNIIKMYGDEHLEGSKSIPLLICSALYFINVLISYPFLFIATRDTIMNLIYPNGNNLIQRLIISEVIFIIILGIGLLQIPIDDIVRWKGALACPMVNFLFPAILGFKLLPNKTTKDRYILYSILIMGILAVITGAIFCILKTAGIGITPMID